MILFLDTSSLFKLYHEEPGTEELDMLFNTQDVQQIIMSELTKVEFNSTVWKKIRMQDITLEQGNKLISLFKDDFQKYTFIEIDEEVIGTSMDMLDKFGDLGLRTLDSIQLSTAYLAIDQIDIGLTSDKLLGKLFRNIGVKTEINL